MKKTLLSVCVMLVIGLAYLENVEGQDVVADTPSRVRKTQQTDNQFRNFEWRYSEDRSGHHQLWYSAEKFRLIIIQYTGPNDLKNFQRAFEDAAKLYERRNITVNLNKEHRNGNVNSSDPRNSCVVIAGYYNYTRDTYGFQAITSVGDVNGSGFRYVLNSGKRFRAFSDNWIRKWWKLGEWELDWSGGVDRIGIQTGHHRGNTGQLNVIFRHHRSGD